MVILDNTDNPLFHIPNTELLSDRIVHLHSPHSGLIDHIGIGCIRRVLLGKKAALGHFEPKGIQIIIVHIGHNHLHLLICLALPMDVTVACIRHPTVGSDIRQSNPQDIRVGQPFCLDGFDVRAEARTDVEINDIVPVITRITLPEIMDLPEYHQGPEDQKNG